MNKFNNIKSTILVVLLTVVVKVNAQETITVPLSEPSKSGFLNVSIINGSIKVKGTDREDVKITANSRENQYATKKVVSTKKSNGLKKISNNNLQFNAYEYDNEVKLKASTYGVTDFEIEVPKNFSLKLSTNNDGDIYVENVNGVMDVSNLNGKITLKNISGAVSADALNKDITVNFIDVKPDTPMAFSSLNGDIDLTFPESFKADVKIKSERGDIYTDFEFVTDKSNAEVTKQNKEKGYSVKVERWVTSKINGGGAELLLKNYNGDIILRSNKS